MRRRTTMRAHGQLGSGHLRTNLRLEGFRGESLELTSYLFCPGLADIHRNGTAVTTGPPPLWSGRAATSRLALSSPDTSRSLLGKGRLGCWGGEGLLWPAYGAGANAAAPERTGGCRGCSCCEGRIFQGRSYKTVD